MAVNDCHEYLLAARIPAHQDEILQREVVIQPGWFQSLRTGTGYVARSDTTDAYKGRNEGGVITPRP
jgi:hypothetical protein